MALTVGKVIYSILTSDSDVSGLISTRVYPVIAPQNATYPAVIYNTTMSPTPTKDRDSAVDEYVVQLDSYAANTSSTSGADKANDLSEKIRTALARYGHGTVQSVVLDGVQTLASETYYEPDVNLYRVSDEFQVRIKPDAIANAPVLSSSGSTYEVLTDGSGFTAGGTSATISGTFPSSGFGEKVFIFINGQKMAKDVTDGITITGNNQINFPWTLKATDIIEVIYIQE